MSTTHHGSLTVVPYLATHYSLLPLSRGSHAPGLGQSTLGGCPSTALPFHVPLRPVAEVMRRTTPTLVRQARAARRNLDHFDSRYLPYQVIIITTTKLLQNRAHDACNPKEPPYSPIEYRHQTVSLTRARLAKLNDSMSRLRLSRALARRSVSRSSKRARALLAVIAGSVNCSAHGT